MIRTGSAADLDAAYGVLAACHHGSWFDFNLDALRELWPFYAETGMAGNGGVGA